MRLPDMEPKFALHHKTSKHFERDKEISVEVLSGGTLFDVGISHGITRERVRQVVNHMLFLSEAPLKRGVGGSYSIVEARVNENIIPAIQSLTQ
jgi:hypothetical protein